MPFLCIKYIYEDILCYYESLKRDFLSGNRKCKDHQEWQQQPFWEIHRDQLWQEVPDHRSKHEDLPLREIQSHFSGSTWHKDIWHHYYIWLIKLKPLFYSGRQRAKLSHILPAVFLRRPARVQESKTVWVFALRVHSAGLRSIWFTRNYYSHKCIYCGIILL